MAISHNMHICLSPIVPGNAILVKANHSALLHLEVVQAEPPDDWKGFDAERRGEIDDSLVHLRLAWPQSRKGSSPCPLAFAQIQAAGVTLNLITE